MTIEEIKTVEDFGEFFRERLSSIRIKKGITAETMSLDLERSPGFIHSLETGNSLPSVRSLFQVIEYLGVTFSEFFDIRNINPLALNKIVEAVQELDEEELDILAALIEKLNRYKQQKPDTKKEAD